MPTPRTTQNTVNPQDAISALEALHRAMVVSQRIMDEAASEHRQALEFQLRDKYGIEEWSLKEPYLAEEKQRVQLQYVQTMERLFDRIYKYVEGEQKSLADLFDYEMGEGDDPSYIEERPYIHIKALNPRAALLPQIEQRIAIETIRAERRLKQGLDKLRQQESGITHYIWRTQDDNRVRDAHAKLDDRIFSWADGAGGEHPGTAYGCRCWAEPTVINADNPAVPRLVESDSIFEPTFDPDAEGTQVAVAPVAVIGVITVAARIAAAADKLRKAKRAVDAARAAGVLLDEDAEDQQTPTDDTQEESENQTGGTGAEPPEDDEGEGEEKPDKERDWEYGEHKSRKKWENQMQERNWTEDQITDTINNGEKHEAPNRVRQNDPDATATRYEKDGRFVVVDDQTGKLLQVSGPGDFKPIPFP